MEKLAIHGGTPVYAGTWPIWPRADENTEKAVLAVLRSGRWAISGFYTGKKCYEKQFADAFAAYCGSAHCVPCTNGSAALVMALEALGIGPGDEVLVPAVTWVACSTAVFLVGATPVLVDINPATLCLCPRASEAAITSRTAAVILVHLYSNLADVGAFQALCRKHGIALVEDCSQAHGAEWSGIKVGNFGVVGTFSMQQTKLLTSGEGGAVITSDANLGSRLEELRANGRRYAEAPDLGQMELQAHGTVLGTNHGMSEFHAAILLERLRHLDTENQIRQERALAIEQSLAADGLIWPASRLHEITFPTFQQLALHLQADVWRGADIAAVAKALTAELNVSVQTIDTPLNRNPLYSPLKSPRIKGDRSLAARFDPTRFSVPCASQAAHEWIRLPHWVLLADSAQVNLIAVALRKLHSAC